MTAPVRPRRSALYVPASNERALEKARGLDADVVIIDLEDAVAPAAKAQARTRAVAALVAGGFGHREVVVRVNGDGTPWVAEDLRAVAGSGADALLLPKVETAATVRIVEATLAAYAAPRELALWAMIETPAGVLAAPEIARASERLTCLVAGTSDLVKDLHARHSPGRVEVLAALSVIVLAARASGLACLDGVHLDLDDQAGFEAACRQGRDLGFDGKTLIHPKTIAAANHAFGPSAEEQETARRIVAAHAEARAAGQGVTVVDGRLVEGLHVEAARQLLALAAAILARGQR
jgi:citrate lyase subunit beta/citryl-CoA lyase